MKIFTGMGILTLLLLVLSNLFLNVNFNVSQLIFPFVSLVLLPLITYISAKKSYRTNSRFSETIIYRFLPENLEMVGESFQSTFTWDKVYKVTQSKKWILIWQNTQVANPILKRDIWEGDLFNLKEILGRNKVKNNL